MLASSDQEKGDNFKNSGIEYKVLNTVSENLETMRSWDIADAHFEKGYWIENSQGEEGRIEINGWNKELWKSCLIGCILHKKRILIVGL